MNGIQKCCSEVVKQLWLLNSFLSTLICLLGRFAGMQLQLYRHAASCTEIRTASLTFNLAQEAANANDFVSLLPAKISYHI